MNLTVREAALPFAYDVALGGYGDAARYAIIIDVSPDAGLPRPDAGRFVVILHGATERTDPEFEQQTVLGTLEPDGDDPLHYSGVFVFVTDLWVAMWITFEYNGIRPDHEDEQVEFDDPPDGTVRVLRIAE